MVEHTSHPPKVKGLSPVTGSSTGIEKMASTVFLIGSHQPLDGTTIQSAP